MPLLLAEPFTVDWSAFSTIAQPWEQFIVTGGQGRCETTATPDTEDELFATGTLPVSPSEGDNAIVAAWATVNAGTPADVSLAYDFIDNTNTGPENSILLIARWDGNFSTPTMYALEVSNFDQEWWLYKVIAGVWTQLGNGSFDPSDSATARQWFRVRGTDVARAATATSDPEPDWSIDGDHVTDSDITGTGACGLAFTFLADAHHSTIDNFYAFDLALGPAPLMRIDVREIAFDDELAQANPLDLYTVNVNPFDVVVAPLPVMVPTPPDAETGYVVHSVDMTGRVWATYPTARVTGLGWPAVNAPMTATFEVPIDAARLDELPLANEDTTPVREVQIWRNGALIFWGPPLTRRANSRERVWTYQCEDPLAYLRVRFMGEAKRRNFLPNGSFPDFTGWTTFGTLTRSISTSRHNLGATSAKLETTDEGDNFIYAEIPMHATPVGLAVFVTGWVFVESYVGPAHGHRGLFIQRNGTVTGRWFAAAHLDENATPVGKWSRLDAYVAMPPNATETIQVRLYAPHGAVYWDAVTVTIAESLSFINANSVDPAGWDQTLIARMTLRYLSGRFPIGASYTKSNLNIADAGDPSGITKERTYQFYDHQPGYTGGDGSGALDEWPKSSDGFDYEIEIRPGARIFRTHYPSIGKVWPRPFVYRYDAEDDGAKGSSWCITGWDEGETVEGSATNVCELGGWGTGSGREEGGFADLAALGGVTREIVESAPSDAPIDLLDSIAQSRGAQVSQPIKTPVLTLTEPRDEDGVVLLPLVGVMKPGDVITVDLIDGSVVFDGVWRVASVAKNPDETLAVGIAK